VEGPGAFGRAEIAREPHAVMGGVDHARFLLHPISCLGADSPMGSASAPFENAPVQWRFLIERVSRGNAARRAAVSAAASPFEP